MSRHPSSCPCTLMSTSMCACVCMCDCVCLCVYEPLWGLLVLPVCFPALSDDGDDSVNPGEDDGFVIEGDSITSARHHKAEQRPEQLSGYCIPHYFPLFLCLQTPRYSQKLRDIPRHSSFSPVYLGEHTLRYSLLFLVIPETAYSQVFPDILVIAKILPDILRYSRIPQDILTY